ncbi:hypothetical protein [Streptomyces cucumeris]|uniref:hypothetical protein n=1 Tax=Streptomyces cucumeris TaxID=2962890 RepID=UPI0020C86922|nr:hypothetical protein [Streptomyces sp. NEAU-Y11]MCP9209751.1 hypothetical protein [Streptomyces sp. NEAU-Y11]
MDTVERVAVLGSGPFGRQVAGMLERCHPGVGLRSGEGRIADTVARCGRRGGTRIRLPGLPSRP